uniref:Uncharacterized protein n=1 Tax=Oryza nivara TaxID=4536 RepID=A0A0E0J4P1_ORYNI
MDFYKIEFSEAKRILAAALLTSDDEEDGKPPATMEKRKTKMARFTQQQIKNCMAFSADISDDDEESLPKLSEVLSKDILNRVPPEVLESLIEFENTREERKARWEKLRDDLHEERDAILKQYYAKGYAEYEVYDDEDEDNKVPARVAPPGRRRRFRNGVAVKKNQSGGNIRKI